MKNSILLTKSDGSQLYSDEAYLYNNNLNRWKGWNCSLGSYFLRIDKLGFATWGNCDQKINIGNVLDNDFTLDPIKNHIICTQDSCTCFADLSILKYKNDALDIVKVEPASKDFDFNIYFSLDIKCNFNCEYCPPTLHSNTFAKDVSVTEKIVRKVSSLVKNRKVHVNLSGGEPTLFNDLIEWASLFDNGSNKVMVTTNGSRSVDFYSKLSKYAEISFSVHLHQPKIEKLASKINKLSKQNTKDISVQIIYPPNNFEKFSAFTKTLEVGKFNIQIQKLTDLTNHGPYLYSEKDNRIISFVNEKLRK